MRCVSDRCALETFLIRYLKHISDFFFFFAILSQFSFIAQQMEFGTALVAIIFDFYLLYFMARLFLPPYTLSALCGGAARTLVLIDLSFIMDRLSRVEKRKRWGK